MHFCLYDKENRIKTLTTRREGVNLVKLSSSYFEKNFSVISNAP
jgi:hypothetical protein